ncbi:MAG: L-threonylcarbamoyladenylate synthase [Cytophagales bacterium]|nr:L-threonylcarbamoyladenylate synthase [Cytophagales bacterium]
MANRLIDSAHLALAPVPAAAQALAAGELVAFPTETVYGLGADASNDAAIANIFAAKGRPSDHPLIVHLASPSGVAAFASDVPAFAQALIAAFWPGPLTVILPRKPRVAKAAAGGQHSIGLRCPSHPMALSLLRAAHKLGVLGIAAPSANRFGRVSPTSAAHVRDEFAQRFLILDGGDCAVGIESTIVDCTRGVPVLLRHGMIAVKALEAACGERVYLPHELEALLGKASQAPKASGTLASHYAPRAKVRLLTAPLNATTHAALYARTRAHWQAGAHQTLRAMPSSAEAAAHELFAVLRELDASGVAEIWVETPPADAAWDGVRDRLTRAAADCA